MLAAFGSSMKETMKEMRTFQKTLFACLANFFDFTNQTDRDRQNDQNAKALTQHTHSSLTFPSSSSFLSLNGTQFPIQLSRKMF